MTAVVFSAHRTAFLGLGSFRTFDRGGIRRPVWRRARFQAPFLLTPGAGDPSSRFFQRIPMTTPDTSSSSDTESTGAVQASAAVSEPTAIASSTAPTAAGTATPGAEESSPARRIRIGSQHRDPNQFASSDPSSAWRQASSQPKLRRSPATRRRARRPAPKRRQRSIPQAQRRTFRRRSANLPFRPRSAALRQSARRPRHSKKFPRRAFATRCRRTWKTNWPRPWAGLRSTTC